MNDKSSAIEYLKIDNLDIYDTKLKTEEFAKHFSSVRSNYANRITKPHTTFTEYLRKIANNPKSIFMSPTNKTEIERLIEKLPNKKSRGHDDISNLLLKNIKSSISYPLEIIFNKSLLEGSFPEMMKQADVTHYINPRRSIWLTITDLYHCYLLSLKYLKKLCTLEHIISYVTVTSFIKANMGSGQNTPVKMPYVN